MFMIARRNVLKGIGGVSGISVLPGLAWANDRRDIVVGVQRLPENISPGKRHRRLLRANIVQCFRQID